MANWKKEGWDKDWYKMCKTQSPNYWVPMRVELEEYKVPFNYALPPWTLDITRRSCMWENKCLHQLKRTIKGLYSASSQVQSLRNVRMSTRVNRAGHCPENSQWDSGRVDDVSIMWLGQNQKNTNIWWGGRQIHVQICRYMYIHSIVCHLPLRFPKRTFTVTSCLLHAPSSPRLNQNEYFMLVIDNFLSCATCVNGQHRTMSRPDSLESSSDSD